MFNQDKRKHDETPYHWSWSTRLKVILAIAILGIIVHSVLSQLGDPWSIKETPDASTLDKINALNDQAYKVPEFISANFASLAKTPICAAVDMQELVGYRPQDVMAWSEMWFNDRRLPPEEVSITIRDVVGYWGVYTEHPQLATRSALEFCFRRGLISNEGEQSHLLRISVHDSFVHEVLSYEWAFRLATKG